MSEIRGLSQALPGLTPEPKGKIGSSGGPSFKDVLSDLTKPAATPQASSLKFSNHAVERMFSRGINLKPNDMTRLEGAIQKAEQKGSKDTLVLLGENAFIVNVKNKTVVTAMDQNQMKENVFTNIDSTIVL
ncbi:MAG: TIGR02530 family flagellar biosynthesis protein [Bdellovibrionales bacterium]